MFDFLTFLTVSPMAITPLGDPPSGEEPICETDTLAVRGTPNKGRGVFAKRPFVSGELIERVPIIRIPEKEAPQSDHAIYPYTFAWGENDEEQAIALGFGSLYNFSPKPNAYWETDHPTLSIGFFAQKDIEAGEEICINYRQNSPGTPLWFEPAHI